MIETLVCYFTAETQEQTEQSTNREEWAPKKAKTVSSTGKSMASVFLGARVIIFIDYLEKQKIINGQHYEKLIASFERRN